MQLQILARGHAGDIILRIIRQQAGDNVQLLGTHIAAGQLDAHHVDAFLPLAVDTLLQADGLKTVFIQTTLQIAFDRFSILRELFLVNPVIVMCHSRLLFSLKNQATMRNPIINKSVASAGLNQRSGIFLLSRLPR